MPVTAAVLLISTALLAYSVAGYPWLMRHLARAAAARPLHELEKWPAVTCVVVAFDEAARIGARVENLLASDYPDLRVIVVSDGSTDGTAARARAVDAARVLVLEQPERSGKAAGLNAALAHSQSDLVVFADARQRFEAGTIRRLARHFADPEVGAVSGSLEIEPSASGVGRAVDTYWRIEKRLREDEARFDSCIGCTGAVYALRRALFTPIPADTLLDDVVIPMQAAAAGARVLHDPEALAFDPQPLDPAREQERKCRTLAGNFQMLFRYPHWLLPWRNRLWWQLISHKYLRLTWPLLLVAALWSSVALAWHPALRLVALAQLAAYALAGLGMLTGSKRRALSLPAGFVFLNVAIVRACWRYLAGSDLHHWRATGREKH